MSVRRTYVVHHKFLHKLNHSLRQKCIIGTLLLLVVPDPLQPVKLGKQLLESRSSNKTFVVAAAHHSVLLVRSTRRKRLAERALVTGSRRRGRYPYNI